MIWAALNDLFQRFMTFNKLEQRKKLAAHLERLGLKKGSKVLDFGCGTGLFAKAIVAAGLDYHGYDVDSRLTDYARMWNRKCTFTVKKEDLARIAPFDLVIANCCFHHIPDEVLGRELNWIRSLLSESGVFLMIDLLLAQNDPSFLRRRFRRLEKGAFLRKREDYQKLVAERFKIEKSLLDRSHVFSIKNPVYNDLLVLECKSL